MQAFGKYGVPFDAAGLDMASISYYKAFGPNRIGALVVGRRALDMVTQNPLINSSLMQSDLTHGGTQSMALVAAALNSLKVVSINRSNKNKRLLALRMHLVTGLRKEFEVAEYTDIHTNWEQAVRERKWLLISFSPVACTVPSTFMFTLIRRIDGKLDAPCGFKLLKHFADNDIIVATGSACGQTTKAGNVAL